MSTAAWTPVGSVASGIGLRDAGLGGAGLGSAVRAGVSPMEAMLEQLMELQKACGRPVGSAVGLGATPDRAARAATQTAQGGASAGEGTADARPGGGPSSKPTVDSRERLDLDDTFAVASAFDAGAGDRPKLSRAEQSRINGSKSRGDRHAKRGRVGGANRRRKQVHPLALDWMPMQIGPIRMGCYSWITTCKFGFCIGTG